MWAGLGGFYIIQDQKFESENGLNLDCDIPLLIQDRIISENGSLLYPPSTCDENTKWIPEAFGNVNVVNGVVMPYVRAPSKKCRLRLVNGANARTFNLTIPFHGKFNVLFYEKKILYFDIDSCIVIASQGGFVRNPYRSPSTLQMFPADRIELVCDFNGLDFKQFNITDGEASVRLFDFITFLI